MQYLPFFFALMPTESGEAITKAIDCGIEALYTRIGTRILFDGNLKYIITCLQHLLFAGRIPGSKAVENCIKDVLKTLHKCTSLAMVTVAFTAVEWTCRNTRMQWSGCLTSSRGGTCTH